VDSVSIGFCCRFCKSIVRTKVPAGTTGQLAAAVLDQLLTNHLGGHVDDFLYGEGGVFSGAVGPGSGPVRPADPPA
jgi:hypothetical protein